MLGYKIKINSIPVCLWACETTINDYKWNNKHSKDMLEISLSRYSTKTVLLKGQKRSLVKSDLSCIISDTPFEAECPPGEDFDVVSVCVRMEQFELVECALCCNDSFDRTVILLPALIEDIPPSDELEILKIMHEIIKFSNDASENAKVMFLSRFYALVYQVDALTRRLLQQQTEETMNLTRYYLKKVDYIISTQYAQKLSLNTIAESLNLSYEYLSSLYKKHSGITFTDRLLQERMMHAEALLRNQNIPTAKVAALCGFCDENYFRKQFKRYFGITVKECRMFKNSITLYHEKPVR